MMAGAVYTLPAQRNVPLPVAMQRLIPMATQGGKPRSFTLPRDSNLHSLLAPPTKEEPQPRNGEFAAMDVGYEQRFIFLKLGVDSRMQHKINGKLCEADGFLFESPPFKSQATHHATL